MKIKIIQGFVFKENQNNEKYIYLDEGETKFNYEENVILNNENFKNKSRYIKIFYDKKVIYRKAISGNSKGLKKDEIGLLARDIFFLKLEPILKQSENENINIKISSNYFNFIFFLFKHPNIIVRITFISLIVSFISLLISILSILCF